MENRALLSLNKKIIKVRISIGIPLHAIVAYSCSFHRNVTRIKNCILTNLI